MKNIFKILFLSIILPATSLAANFSTTNIQFLHGSNYKLTSHDTRQIFTIEHFNDWKYGDNFFFLDITNPNKTNGSGANSGIELYSEFTSRFSVSKITGKDLSAGFFKDILLAGQFEAGRDDFNTRSYLVGVGLDWNIPHFTYFNTNIYRRDSVSSSTATGSTWQVTAVWHVPLKFDDKIKFVFEGFTDIVGKEGSKAANWLFVPQLQFDIGNLFGNENQYLAGIEYSRWNNKFGVKGTDENAVQLLLKWIF